jgi:hypothetical protein
LLFDRRAGSYGTPVTGGAPFRALLGAISASTFFGWIVYWVFSDGLCVEGSVPISLPVAFPFSIPVGPVDDG